MYNLKGSLGLQARFCKENITILNAKSGLIYHLGRIVCMLLVLVLVHLLCCLLFFSFSLGMTFSYLLFFLVFTLCVFLGVKKILIPVYQIFYFYPRTYKGGQEGVDATTRRFFCVFSQRIKHQHLMFSVAVRSSLAPILSQVQ